MSKVIVTGGAGFIGSHLVDRLVDEDYDVVVFDDESADKDQFYWNLRANNRKRNTQIPPTHEKQHNVPNTCFVTENNNE